MKLKVFEIMLFRIERNNKYCSQIFFNYNSNWNGYSDYSQIEASNL